MTTLPTELMHLAQQFMQGRGAGQRIGMSPWAVDAKRLADSFRQVDAIRSPDGPSQAANALSRRGSYIGGGSYATRVGNTAIVPVIGPLMSRYSYRYWSYDEIIRDLRMVAAEDGIEAILLDIDSPGGMVANCDAVVDEIARIREAVPVHAHIGGLGASAAYWVASAAETVSAGKTALVGSVGALISYVDMEGILTKLGARVVEVIAEQSPNKRLDPESEEGQAELQAIVDHAAELFIGGLVEQRSTNRETILEQYGQGLVFPSDAALERGMIDDVVSFEEILAKLADRHGSIINAVSAAAPATKEHTMTGKDNSAANSGPLPVASADIGTITAGVLREGNPELAASIENEGADAERARILGIDEQAAGLTGHDDLVAAMKADGKTTPPEAAVKLLAAEKAKPAADKSKVEEQLKGLEKLDKAAEGVESTPSETGESGEETFAQNPDGWKAQWEASEKLQKEFPTADAYVATMKRDSRKSQ